MISQQKITVGLVGFGLSGRYFHAPFLSTHPGFELRKVVTSRPDEVATFDPGLSTVSTADELFADDSIQLIFICSPNETHFQYAKAALEHNKHVVVEKPFATNESETDQLLELAEKRGLMATAYQNRRWDSDFLTVKQLIDESRLGDVLDYEARYDRLMPVDSRNQSWKEQPGEGRGSLYNLGPHLIDQALQLFGKPESVSAEVRIVRPNSRIEDLFTIRLGYTGKQVTLKSSLMMHQNQLRFSVHGTAGSFVKGGLDVQEEELRKNRLPNEPSFGYEPTDRWGTLTANGQSEQIESLVGTYGAFYEGLHASLVDGAEPMVKPHEIRQIARVIALAQQSSLEGRTLPF
ncbi:Gfo/Idh/MocA family oxidoreductase [Spirosoma fluviale]|uniref:Scyllo-inositol 2-dehydrogenase (NADP+) n=1 Tax=Spirosoma fluviale TaxID=1597977 RepID=A0A286GKX1_9BACT|nr:Gfo/Idh/MocA family oxidoreductase [Spirosoma fluviale]SOD96181.1 scyllo-inositol 2-dehydrogenase (NADP+) [Spirosoma fluviale]